MAKLNFLKRLFNKKKPNGGDKSNKGRQRRRGRRREGSGDENGSSGSCIPPANEAVVVAVFAGATLPDEEKNNNNNNHNSNHSQHQQLLDDLSNVSQSCINNEGRRSTASSFEHSSLDTNMPYHGPIDVDTCRLLQMKLNKSDSNITNGGDTSSERATADGTIDRYTDAESSTEDLNIRSIISLRSRTTSEQASVDGTEHELELIPPSASQYADTTSARASTPEKGDLLPQKHHQEECNSSPTSIFMFDSTNGVVDDDIDPRNKKPGNNANGLVDEATKLPSFVEQRIDMNNRTTSSASYQAMIASLITSPPDIIRHMPAEIFGNATNTLSSMWNLEDTAAALPTASPSPTAIAKEFLALKKDAEKNEFKNATLLSNSKKCSGAAPSSVAAQDGTKKGTYHRPAGVGEVHEIIEIEVNQEKKKDFPSVLSTTDAQCRSDIPSQHPSASAYSNEDIDLSSSRSLSPSNVIVDIIQTTESQQFLDEMQPDDGTISDDSYSYDSEFDTIGEITICSETKRLMEAHRLYEEDIKNNIHHPARDRRSILKVKMPIKEIYVGGGGGGGETKIADSSSASIRTESIKTELDNIIAMEEDTLSLPSIVTQQQKKITWYDDEANWNKPLTLRTDESFDTSTVSSSRVSTRSGYSRNMKQYNVMDQLLGDFIEGIGKYTCYDDEIIATTFDKAEEQEI